MSDIIQTVKCILHSKKYGECDETIAPYILQRWCSMYSPQVATILNDCYNDSIYKCDLYTVDDHVKIMGSILPKLPTRSYKYIKKGKSAKERALNRKEQEFEECVTRLTEIMQLSKREVRELLSTNH